MTTATLETFEREEKRRLEKILPLESPRLKSLTEAHAERICPGYLIDEGCVNKGDEPEPGDELCSACIREEERFYQREMWAADGETEIQAYPHLTDRS